MEKSLKRNEIKKAITKQDSVSTMMSFLDPDYFIALRT